MKPLLLGLQCMKLLAPEGDLEGAWEGRGEENPVTFKVSSDVTQGDLSKPTCMSALRTMRILGTLQNLI